MNIDWSALWDLGGHGRYVWPAYLAAAALVVAEAVSLLRRLWRAPAKGDA